MFLRIPKEFINEPCLADGHKNNKTLKAHLFRDMDYQFNQTPKLMMKLAIQLYSCIRNNSLVSLAQWK